MKTKVFEIRDSGTFIPVCAILMMPDDEPERYLLRRSGYGIAANDVMLVKMGANGIAHQASYDVYGWGTTRTMQVAHEYINTHFDKLDSGAVVDVEFILGETDTPKISEAKEVA